MSSFVTNVVAATNFSSAAALPCGAVVFSAVPLTLNAAPSQVSFGSAPEQLTTLTIALIAAMGGLGVILIGAAARACVLDRALRTVVKQQRAAAVFSVGNPLLVGAARSPAAGGDVRTPRLNLRGMREPANERESPPPKTAFAAPSAGAEAIHLRGESPPPKTPVAAPSASEDMILNPLVAALESKDVAESKADIGSGKDMTPLPLRADTSPPPLRLASSAGASGGGSTRSPLAHRVVDSSVIFRRPELSAKALAAQEATNSRAAIVALAASLPTPPPPQASPMLHAGVRALDMSIFASSAEEP